MAKATWNDVVLAESDKYEEVEGNVYFPPESVKWDYFKSGDRQYTCPWKGKAAYYDIVVKGKTKILQVDLTAIQRRKFQKSYYVFRFLELCCQSGCSFFYRLYA